MNNFVQEGGVLRLVAPYAVSSGHGALVGSIFGVATGDVASGDEGAFAVEGVFTLAKTSAQAWTQGDKIYWDNSNKRCDNVGTVGRLIGVATDDAASPSSTGTVRLNEGVSPEATGPQAAVADLVDNSGGATADGTIGAVTNPTLSAWNGSTDPTAAEATAINAAITALKDAVKELSTKQNAILAKLRAAEIIAT